jgi:hypothetical protein
MVDRNGDLPARAPGARPDPPGGSVGAGISPGLRQRRAAGTAPERKVAMAGASEPAT